MIVCLYGDPRFLSKMIPVSKLNSQFLMDQVSATTQVITSGGGQVKAIISDGNRTNQTFFKRHQTVPDKPWLTEDGKYLFFDNPHLLKCIRNLWLIEKTGESPSPGVIRIAKWLHLKQLYDLESKTGTIVKMSKLDDIAIHPNQ